MTRWAVWSDADGWLTDPMADQHDAYLALEQLTATGLEDDDPEEPGAMPANMIPVVLPVCPHGQPTDRCGTCR
jgi:hypothetical protein